jgi:drug/metabolite transporter (DMT)-like permease
MQTPSSTPAKVHLTLLLVQLLFGGFHVVGKAVLGEVEPLALAALRVLIATPLLAAFAYAKDRRDPVFERPPEGGPAPWRRFWPRLALLGLLGVFANQVLFLIGLDHTTASDASILMPSIPVFAMVLGVVLGVETVGPRRLLGVALTIAGAALMLDVQHASLHSGNTLGNLLVLANCLAYSAFLVLQRPVLEHVPWRTVIAASFVCGGVPVLGLSLPALLRMPWGDLSWGVWAGIGYVTVVATGLGYLLATWAVRRSSPLLVAAYTTLQPLASTTLAVLFLGETVGWSDLAAGVLILLGLLAVSRRRRARV